MKEIVKKLVHALEDKATTDLIAGNSPFAQTTNPGAGHDTSTSKDTQDRSLRRRKASEAISSNDGGLIMRTLERS